jgi:hypothetical protein
VAGEARPVGHRRLQDPRVLTERFLGQKGYPRGLDLEGGEDRLSRRAQGIEREVGFLGTNPLHLSCLYPRRRSMT